MQRRSLWLWIGISLGVHLCLVWIGQGHREEGGKTHSLLVHLLPVEKSAEGPGSAASSPPPPSEPRPARPAALSMPETEAPSRPVRSAPVFEAAPENTGQPESEDHFSPHPRAARAGDSDDPAGGKTSIAEMPDSAASHLSAPAPPPLLVRAEPAYDMNPPPPYPRPALERRWEGTVLLQVRVTAAGDVAELTIERTSGHPLLDRAALAAVRSWRFHPARVGEEAVEGTVIVPVAFTLRRS